MQSQQETVLSQKSINTTQIVYDDIIMTQNDQFAVAKIWYQPSSDKLHSLLYQTSVLPIYSYDSKTNKFHLKLNENTEQNILSTIDQMSINYIKSTGLLKRLMLSPQKVRYRTIVTDFTNKENEKINSIELKNTTKTKYYSNGVKKSKNLEDVENLLKKNVNVKTIIEIDGLVVDIKKESITTNIILHQFKIEKIKPKKIELNEYSFLESETDEDTEEEKQEMELVTINEENNNVDDEGDEENDDNEEIVQEISKKDIIEIEDESDNISDSNESEGNSYEEESSEDLDVEEFVTKLKQTQSESVKQKDIQKIQTPPKPKRGRPAKK